MLWLFLFAQLGISCSGHRLQQPPVASQEIPLELHWVKNSAEYRAITLQTYAMAGFQLEKAVTGKTRGTWAVSLDADETILDNSSYQVWLSETGEVYGQENWQAWVRLEEAGAVPGAAGFLERIHELGGVVAIVTNRRAPICEATESNLEALALPYDLILCRSDEGSKEPRWEKIKAGEASADFGPLEIVMWLGDNIRDFPGWDQSRRHEAKTSFDEFGARFFVMPNPLYGSFESNPR